MPRLALSVREAAAALSVSESTFRRHVLPEVASVVVAGRIRVPVAELERYLGERAV